MTYHLTAHPESRLSLKILAHKIRRYLPKVYEGLLRLRYRMFRRQCRDVSTPHIVYSDGSWVARKTTPDLLRIQTFLQQQPYPLSVLQVGIGNSSLYAAIGDHCRRFIGITVMDDECKYARQIFPTEYGNRYDVRLMNKYAPDIMQLGDGFDFIVDNDLSSYACCHRHFSDLLTCYARMLAPHGSVLIGLDGLGYFDSGFGLTPDLIQVLALEHGLVFESGSDFHRLRRAVDLPEIRLVGRVGLEPTTTPL